jgi:hypothetical protein
MTLDLARRTGPGRTASSPGGLRGLLSARPGLVSRMRLDLLLLAGCTAFGALAAVSLKYAIIALGATLLSGWVLAKPQVSAYLLILLTPLIVGVDTGGATATLRPNEALIVLFAVLIAVRWLAGLRTGERRWPRLGKVDYSLIALGLTSSVLPLLMMVARQRPITYDDLLYCTVIWKLLAEYIIVRSVITTRQQAMRCLWLSMISGAIVCAVGILQSLNLLGVPALLAKYYAPLGVESAVSDGRGSSLLALPAATADLAILNLGIAIAMMVRTTRHRKWLAGFAIVYVLGVVAAAEFSTVIGLVVALCVIIALTGYKRLLAYAIPVAIVGGILLWPVIQLRLTGFQSASGLPVSWETRLTNLRTYFWPQLFSDYNWILGVRPSARVPVPTQQYGFVWIESGYTWLLWGGGIPLLGSYIAFVVLAIRKGCAMARRHRHGPSGIAGIAIAAALAAQVLAMLFDPHLTYRGSGDALFLILALARTLPARARARRTEIARPAGQARQQQLPAAGTAAPDRQEVPA